MNLEELNRLERTKDKVDKSYSAIFSIREVLEESGVTREYPFITFKGRGNGYREVTQRVDFVKIINFPEIREEAYRYYQGKYDGSLEDAPESVRTILIAHGIWSRAVALLVNRDNIMLIVERFTDKVKIDAIKYLESIGCFPPKKLKAGRLEGEAMLRGDNKNLSEENSLLKERLGKMEAILEKLMDEDTSKSDGEVSKIDMVEDNQQEC